MQDMLAVGQEIYPAATNRLQGSKHALAAWKAFARGVARSLPQLAGGAGVLEILLQQACKASALLLQQACGATTQLQPSQGRQFTLQAALGCPGLPQHRTVLPAPLQTNMQEVLQQVMAAAWA